MRRFAILVIIGAVLAACGDATLEPGSTAPPAPEPTATSTAATEAPPTTPPPASTLETSTTAATTTTTTEAPPFEGFPVPDTLLCVIDHRSDDALNVRAGPATDYAVVGTLAHDAVGVASTGFGARDDQDRTWLEVDYGAGTGWAAAWLLAPCEVAEARTYCVIDTTCDDWLNVRVGPGGGYPRMGLLAHNAVGVEATGASAHDGNGDLWRQIRYQGEVGWSAGWFLTPSPCTASSGQPCSLPSGPPAPTCVDGWITPAPGTPLWRTGLRHIGVSATGPIDPVDFVVDEMRYCVGPEDAHVIAPRRDVERWYIKGYSEADPAYRSRWISRRIDVGEGLGWVAPYDSTGFGPGIWEDCPDGCRIGNVAGNYCSVGCGDDPQRHPCYPFAPGAWTPGDCSGLPPEVLGCFAGL